MQRSSTQKQLPGNGIVNKGLYEAAEDKLRTTEGFSLGGFVKAVALGGVMEGLGSAAFYGVGKGLESLWRSVKGSKGLSNVEARKWYLEQEKRIADMIDKNLSIEEQAKQAFDLRNQFRTQARELMADRKLAESLYKTDPNRTWEEIVQRQIDKGLTGDDIYKEIIDSSQRSRKTVNKSLGLE